MRRPYSFPLTLTLFLKGRGFPKKGAHIGTPLQRIETGQIASLRSQ